LEPESLREEIRIELERMAKRYERGVVVEESRAYGKTGDVQDLPSL
jgi:hypothetical protein